MNNSSTPPISGHAASHVDAQPPPLLDNELPILLSRMAGARGLAVPVHRFGMQGATASGIAMTSLSRTDQALEMWLGAIPDGTAAVHSQGMEPGLMPALWLASASNAALVVLGKLAGARYAAENSKGERVELSSEQAVEGVFLDLQLNQSAASWVDAEQDSGSPKRATDFFIDAIKKKKNIFFESIVATLVMSAVALGGSLYTMQVYDRVVPTRGYSTLWVLTIGAALAVFFEFLMRQVRAVMVERACKAIDTELSGIFFGRALAIRMDARPPSVGTFVSQIRQFELVRNFMTSSTLFVIADVPCALIFIAVIWMIAGPVALVPLAFLPLVVIVAAMFIRPLSRMAKEHQTESYIKNGLLIESVDGIESIKAASGEWKMLDRWQNLTALIGERELRMRSMTILSANLTQSLQQVTYIVMIIVGVLAIVRSDITMGALIACSIILGRALSPISQAPNLIVQWQSAKAALTDLDKLITLPVDGPARERPIIPTSCVGDLRLEAVRQSYVQNTISLQVPHLKIAAGERVAVLGAVGSGKSTLLKILSGLYKPNEGRSFLDEIDMALLAPPFVREKIGYLPQDVRLFHGTLRDNLVMGLPTPNDAQILEAARITGLDRLIKSHPAGLGLPIMEGGRGLSGGQRQLAGLTRLIIARPDVVLLDEPTASMDAELETLVMGGLVDKLDAKSTLVVVTHKLSMLRHVNRILVIDRGMIVADGPRDEVLARLKAGNAQAQRAGAMSQVRPAAANSSADQSVPSVLTVPTVRVNGASLENKEVSV